MEDGRRKKDERTSLTVHCRKTPCPSPLPVAFLTTVFPVPTPPLSPPATSFRVLVQRGVDLTWQPPIRCSAHPIQYSYSRPAFSDASGGVRLQEGAQPVRTTFPPIPVLGGTLPAVLLPDLPCSLCHAR